MIDVSSTAETTCEKFWALPPPVDELGGLQPVSVQRSVWSGSSNISRSSTPKGCRGFMVCN